MSDDAPPDLQPEIQITLTGPIKWFGGYVVRCKRCGSMAGWQLRVRRDPDPGHVPADDADLTCQTCGKTRQHPLVYPDMVRMLYAVSPGENRAGPEVTAALQAIDWRPHNRIVRRNTAIYLPWEYEPGPDKARWPDLCWVYQGGTLPRPPV